MDPRETVATRTKRLVASANWDERGLLLQKGSPVRAGPTGNGLYGAILRPLERPLTAALQTDDEFFRVNGLVLRNPAVINLLDGCAISIPNHAEGEPPTGLMLACPGGQDHHLFRCAAAAEPVIHS